jgi:hypothetical protein
MTHKAAMLLDILAIWLLFNSALLLLRLVKLKVALMVVLLLPRFFRSSWSSSPRASRQGCPCSSLAID